jgi:hypothetical protein
VVVPVDDFEGKLLTILDTDRVTIRRLKFRIPSSTSPCSPLDSVIFMDESRGTRILANRITAVGENPLSCGYADGIKMDSPREGDSSNITVAWNTITNFAVNGIELCGPDRPSRIHQNSLRFFHEGQDPISRGSAIFVYCSIHSGPTSITGNVVRALPTAGVSTPALNRGIDIGCCVDLVRGNKVSGAGIGIDIDAQVVDTLIRRNTLVGGPNPSESVGAEISSTGGISVRLRGNDITDYDTGVSVHDWSGHVIADNDLRGNTVPCEEVADDGGTPNTWTGNLGCPAPVTP